MLWLDERKCIQPVNSLTSAIPIQQLLLLLLNWLARRNAFVKSQADTEVIAVLLCINSVVCRPHNMPPDHVIILLEGLTTLCQYCLLDGSAQQDVGVAGQMSPLTRTGSSTDSGLLSNLANVFHFGTQRVIRAVHLVS